MKKWNYLLGILCACAFTACGGGPSSTTVTPEEIEGESANLVSYVDESSTLAYSSTENTNVVILKVKLHLNESLEGISEDDIKWGLGNPHVSIMDENGVELTTMNFGNDGYSYSSEAESSFKKFLTSSTGTEKVISFCKAVSDKKRVKEIIKNAKTFKITEMTVETPIDANLSGSVDKYPIMMSLHINGYREAVGAYYYVRMGSGSLLYLKGSKQGNTLSLDEFDSNNKHTGRFEGTFENGKYYGRFKGEVREFQFSLSEDKNMQPIDLKSIDFSKFYRTYESTSSSSDDSSVDLSSIFGSDDDSDDSGSEDWDAILDAFEKYVDLLDKAFDKIENNDPTAVVEYAKMYGELLKISPKLDNAKTSNDLTSAQIARYAKINLKMAKIVAKREKSMLLN
jgi:hypothetical protein